MDRIEIDAHAIRPDRIAEAARLIRKGALAVIPTDTTWAIVADPFQRGAAQRLADLRQKHAGTPERARAKASQSMSLLFGDLAPIGHYVVIGQPQYRLMRRLLPGPYTLILPASREVPRLLQSKRKAVGIRVPDDEISRALLRELGQPLIGCTARDAAGEMLISGPELEEALRGRIDLLLEGPPFFPEPSTVIDWTGAAAELVREGKGALDDGWFDA